MTNKPHAAAVLCSGNVAVVTGAANGIGLAAARRFAALGMRVVLADLGGPALSASATDVASLARAGANDVLAVPTDVSRREDLTSLEAAVTARFGTASVLLNNAGVGNNPGSPWENSAAWQSLFGVNLWGMVFGVEAFVPSMLEANRPALVINTGSKQGITSPPGNAAYNMSKAAVKSYTESLAHALRGAGGAVQAHLLIPGYTFTGMTGVAEKPRGAWTPEQVVDFMVERLMAGDFYILCPDNAVTRRMDELRIRWAAEDIILNRPALSRWHPDFEAEFARYMASELEP